MSRQRLIDGFLASSTAYPDNIALDTAGEQITYRELLARARAIAATIARSSDEELCGILAEPTVLAYAGMLGSLIAGRGFLPLNPSQPVERLSKIVNRAKLGTLIASPEGLRSAAALAATCPQLRAILTPADVEVPPIIGRLVQRIDARASEDLQDRLASIDHSSIAYVMFTSGSTGEPKGVRVTNGNVVAYVENVRPMVKATSDDRFAQTSENTFDLSVHPIWVAWECGAALCVVPERERMAPARFIREKGITAWTSVPSVVTFLNRLHALTPGAFPTIRHSMFCGEPLTADQVKAWQLACPNSVIDNFYGPTEATCAITSYRCARPLQDDAAPNGVISIGRPFNGQRTLLLDGDAEVTGPDQAGELLLQGTQVSAGYLNDPETTASKYVRVPGFGQTTWYRTGDLARRSGDCLYFIGRADQQVKILGFRVELQDIEAAVRDASRAETVSCIAWPLRDGSAQGVECFISAPSVESTEATILQYCREHLPDYMVPRRVHTLSVVPLSQNGKIDRKALTALLESQAT